MMRGAKEPGTHTLFVGTRRDMDRWMAANGISPFQDGRTVHLALNGPEHIRGVPAPVRVVYQRGWTPATATAARVIDEAVTAAAAINGQLLSGPIPEVFE